VKILNLAIFLPTFCCVPLLGATGDCLVGMPGRAAHLIPEKHEHIHREWS